ncbi:hypothetical protein ACFP6B_09600, partial [Rothia nasimurium]
MLIDSNNDSIFLACSAENISEDPKLFITPLCVTELLFPEKLIFCEAYSKVPPAAKNTNPRTTANTRPYNPN